MFDPSDFLDLARELGKNNAVIANKLHVLRRPERFTNILLVIKTKWTNDYKKRR